MAYKRLNRTIILYDTDINVSTRCYEIQCASSVFNPAPGQFKYRPQPAWYLCSFRSPVHLYAKIIAVLLPVKFAVHHVEQIAHSDLVPGRKLHEGHPRWDILVLGNPERNDVITGGPGEISAEDSHHEWAFNKFVLD